MIDGGLRPIFRQKLVTHRAEIVHWQSIETGGTGNGIPDSNYCCAGVEGWVEFKATETFSVKFEPEQPAWHSKRSRCGGRTFIAVRRQHDGGPRKGPGVDELWLLRGGAAVQIQDRGLTESAEYVLGRWDGGPGRWDWDAVGQILRGDLSRRKNLGDRFSG